MDTDPELVEKMQILDKGYISLVESWGSDEQIIRAARMSTGKGFLGWGSADKPGDEKLLKYLWDHNHCYDAQTEVLVYDKGFVAWPDVKTTDLLGQYDSTCDSLVYEQGKKVAFQFNGLMYRVDHGGVDLLVTPNHKMFVKTVVSIPGENRQAWCADWKLIGADFLGNRAMVRYRKHSARRAQTDIAPILGIFPPHNDPSALLRLIGFFLGDGYAGGTSANSIAFHLKKNRKIEFLKSICAAIGWECASMAHNAFLVRADGLGKLFRNLFYDGKKEKIIPSFLMDLNVNDAVAMLDGLRQSDGTQKRGAWEYSTTSKKLADAVQLLVLHAGGSAHINTDSKKHLYRVMVLSRMLEPVINQSKKNTSMERYDGNVYCAETRTGVLIVRRNGKIVLSGNSTPFEMAGMSIEVKAPIMVIREWHRHRTMSYNEMSARYVPLPDEDYLPSIERLMLNAGGTNKQAQSANGTVLTEDAAIMFRANLEAVQRHAQAVYADGLRNGIPKELARLPVTVSRYSKMRVSANLRNWLAFLKLRCDPAAQWEIRQYSNEVARVVERIFPYVWQVAKGSIMP